MNDDKNLIDADLFLVSKGGLRKFINLAWSQVEPARPFVAGWHIDAIAEHLEAIKGSSQIHVKKQHKPQGGFWRLTI